jgi:hypothetical protein
MVNDSEIAQQFHREYVSCALVVGLISSLLRILFVGDQYTAFEQSLSAGFPSLISTKVSANKLSSEKREEN